jgi:hypothetical protein
MKLGTTSHQHKEQLIQGRGTLQQPINKKFSNSKSRVFSHSELVDLDVPYPIRNRTKRFFTSCGTGRRSPRFFPGNFQHR